MGLPIPPRRNRCAVPPEAGPPSPKRPSDTHSACHGTCTSIGSRATPWLALVCFTCGCTVFRLTIDIYPQGTRMDFAGLRRQWTQPQDPDRAILRITYPKLDI